MKVATGNPPLRREEPRASDRLVGVADAQLRIRVANADLDEILGEPAVGLSLLELASDERVRARLRLVGARVAPVAVLALRSGTTLVVESVGDWILLHRGGSAAPRVPAPSSPSRLVGRAAELLEVERYLTDVDASVLFVRAPLGLGKTAFLDAVVEYLDEVGCPRFLVDACTTPPSEIELFRVLSRDARADAGASFFRVAQGLSRGRWVLLVDNFEAWQSASASSVASPFASFPTDCRIVVASRELPEHRLWERAVRPPRLLELGPLSLEDATALATRSGVPGERVSEVLGYAAGHPLCIVTLAAAARAGASLDRVSLPVSRFANAADLGVLEVASLPSRITEDVLAALLDDGTQASRVYDVLGQVCRRDASGVGLRMPHVVREALRGRMRERSPSRLAALRTRLASHYARLAEQRTTSLPCTAVDDFFDSFDDHPIVREIGGNRIEVLPAGRRATPLDRGRILTALEGVTSAEPLGTIARRLDLAHVHTIVVEEHGGIVGVLQYAAPPGATLGLFEGGDRDVELTAALEGLRRTMNVASADHAVLILAWVTVDGTMWNRAARALFRQLVKVLLTVPRVAATVFVQPPRPEPLPTFSIPGGMHVVAGGRELVVRDLRGVGPRGLLHLLVESSTDRALRPGAVSDPPISIETVREALAALDDPERLAASPLLAMRRLEVDPSQGDSAAARAQALADLLRNMIASLDGGGREMKQRAALYAAFVERSGKHEKIAADLGLPYSTFRRYLTRGIARITERLRERERTAASE